MFHVCFCQLEQIPNPGNFADGRSEIPRVSGKCHVSGSQAIKMIEIVLTGLFQKIDEKYTPICTWFVFSSHLSVTQVWTAVAEHKYPIAQVCFRTSKIASECWSSG